MVLQHFKKGWDMCDLVGLLILRSTTRSALLGLLHSRGLAYCNLVDSFKFYASQIISNKETETETFYSKNIDNCENFLSPNDS